jgi:hypothetical protein
MASDMDVDSDDDLVAQIANTRKALDGYHKANKTRKKQLGGQREFQVCGSGRPFSFILASPISGHKDGLEQVLAQLIARQQGGHCFTSRLVRSIDSPKTR